MFDIFKESTEQKIDKKSISRRNSIKTNTLKVFNEFNEVKSSIVDTNQSGSQSPSSFTNPASPVQKNATFFQNISFKTMPLFNPLQTKVNQIHSRAMKIVKVSNDLKNKIELLVEIYDGPEYRKLKTVNKLVQCNIDIDTPQKIVSNLIVKLNNQSDDMCFGRSIHPAYSNEIADENQSTMDSFGIFKMPGSYQDQTSQEFQPVNNDNDLVDLHTVDTEQQIQEDSIFLEHEGNTYVRVDDANYHLIQSITEDGLITTETGLQFSVPVGNKVPLETNVQELINDDNNISNDNIDFGSHSGPNHYFVDNIPDHASVSVPMHQNRKNYKDNAYLSQYTYQTSNSAKPFSDYVGLPPRPVPHTPFTLSSQLYTPELSISLTDRDCELMLTIDCSKKTLAQQPPLYYQIYSYKDEDRYTKPTSEVWGLVGEISACTLPMFCTISIPSGVHKHYFSIRSVDECNRFSDWSNVVQVEVESNQNSTNGR